jgi:hypothetical protein
MATDAQGRQLSEDGYYYWDGSAWQLVQQDAAQQDTPTAQQDTPTAEDLKAAMKFETESETSPV